jgi:hypothetical protein
MKSKLLGIIGALIISLAVPGFALAERGGRYHNKSGSGGYDRGTRYERGQPYRSSSYHARGYRGGYHGGSHKGYSHGGYYGNKHHHHKSHSSFSFGFGFGSYYPSYPYYGSYYYEPVYVRPAPVYIAPSYYYGGNSCYSRPSSYYYGGEVRYYYSK